MSGGGHVVPFLSYRLGTFNIVPGYHFTGIYEVGLVAGVAGVHTMPAWRCSESDIHAKIDQARPHENPLSANPSLAQVVTETFGEIAVGGACPSLLR